jgi:serine/threonine protein kinase
MATVYLARQADLNRHVALKELRAPVRDGDAEFTARFLHEARTAGSLGHPNIVTVHEYFEHQRSPFIAMEYLERGSLRPMVNGLTLAQVAGALEGLLAGLDHAARQGVVHRDLKPENLMITDSGGLKISDFGIAKAVVEAGTRGFQTATGMTVGTPAYMAPEQALGRSVDHRTDLYSVGVIAYELVLGKLPFEQNDTPMALLIRHVHDPIPPPREVDPNIDPRLAHWIETLLAKSPDDRPATAVAAWELLEETVADILGPFWRREARLLDRVAESSTLPPLTPAPFDDDIAQVVDTDSDAFLTYGRRGSLPEPIDAASVVPEVRSEPNTGSQPEAESPAAPPPAGLVDVTPPTKPHDEDRQQPDAAAARTVPPVGRPPDDSFVWPVEGKDRPGGRDRRRVWLIAIVALALIGAVVAARAFLGGGSETATKASGGGVGSTPTVSLPGQSDQLIVVVSGGSVFVLDPSGRVLKLTSKNLVVKAVLPNAAHPRSLLASSTTVVTLDDSAVTTYSKNLRPKWAQQFKHPRGAASAPGTPPVVAGQTGSDSGQVCLVAVRGLIPCAKLNFVPTSVGAAPGGRIFVVGQNVLLQFRFRHGTLTPLAPATLSAPPVTSALVFSHGRIYYPVAEGIGVFDVQGGHQLKTINLAAAPSSLSASRHGVIYAALYSADTVIAYDASKNTKLWQVQVPQPVSVAATDTGVYVVTASRVVATVNSSGIVKQRHLGTPVIKAAVARKVTPEASGRKLTLALGFDPGEVTASGIAWIDHDITDGRAEFEVWQGGISSSLQQWTKTGVPVSLKLQQHKSVGVLAVIVQTAPSRYASISVAPASSGKAIAIRLRKGASGNTGSPQNNNQGTTGTGPTNHGSGGPPPPPDTTTPVLALPANQNYQVPEFGTAPTVQWTVTATDADGDKPKISCDHQPGFPAGSSEYPYGTTTVSCSAVDDAGNQDTGSFTVTVVFVPG